MSTPVAIVAGASSGIGAATARLLGKRGYRVVLTSRRKDRLDKLASDIKDDGGEVLVVPTDLANLDDIQNLVRDTLQKYGQIDILINSAGYAKLVWLDEQDQDEIDHQIRVNLIGAIQLIREIIPTMKERGQGQIIQITSIASWIGIPTYSIYVTNKFGLRGFLESIRRELRGTGITVTGVYPGAVDTEFDQHAGIDWKFNRVTPEWLLYSPEQVANFILRVIKNKKTTAVYPGIMIVPVLFNAHFPGFVSWILSKLFFRSGGKTVAWRSKPE
jgi:short-subunit dehydrogenase